MHFLPVHVGSSFLTNSYTAEQGLVETLLNPETVGQSKTHKQFCIVPQTFTCCSEIWNLNARSKRCFTGSALLHGPLTYDEFGFCSVDCSVDCLVDCLAAADFAVWASPSISLSLSLSQFNRPAN